METDEWASKKKDGTTQLLYHPAPLLQHYKDDTLSEKLAFRSVNNRFLWHEMSFLSDEVKHIIFVCTIKHFVPLSHATQSRFCQYNR